MMTCIIVDDDTSAITELSNYISNISQLKLLKSFTDPLEAVAFLKNSPVKISILFSDVEMPLLNGLELASLIRDKSEFLIYTTSHSKFAIEAFEVNANAYLLKPFSLAKLMHTIEKINPLFGQILENKNESKDFIFVKSKEDNLKLIKVFFEHIVAFESMLNYVKIHTLTRVIITHISLKEVREVLSNREDFKQLHRSFIVSINHISMIDGNTIVTTTGWKFTIGEKYRNELNNLFQEKTLKPTQGIAR